MTVSSTETFFLPDEVGRKPSRIPADIYNLAHTLLSRSEFSCVFVPIRNLQFLGVITDKEIVFVDSQSYAVSDDEGGRLILVAWQFDPLHKRSSLTDPVPCEVVFYEQNNRELQLRLVAEFRQAIELLDKRYRDQRLPAKGAKILRI